MSQTYRQVLPLGVVVILAVVGIVIANQGWRGRTIVSDMLLYTEEIEGLIESSHLPEHGTLNSQNAYVTPGIAWLMLPGALIFEDTRLWQSIGSGLLYVGTLVGIFLLTRLFFATPAALLAVVLYGFHAHGLFFAHALWPRAHPFFYVWFVYWTCLWVQRSRSIYLGAALITGSVGLYEFLEIAPALLLLPVVWLIYRPPVKALPCLVAVVVSLLIWAPYLAFQVERGFVDLEAQLITRESLLPVDYARSWCNPALAAVFGDNGAAPTLERSGLGTVLFSVYGLARGLTTNYDFVAPLPGASYTLLTLTILGLGVLLRLPERFPLTMLATPSRRLRVVVACTATGALIVGALLSPATVASFVSPDGVFDPPRVLQLVNMRGFLLIAGSALLLWSIFIRRTDTDPAVSVAPPHTVILALGLLIPWLVVLIVAGLDDDRFHWWLWTLQAVALAVGLTLGLRWLRLPRWARLVIQGAVVLVVLVQPTLTDRLTSWWTHGWEGVDAIEVQIAEIIATDLEAQSRSAAVIGYEMPFAPWEVMPNVLEESYKSGSVINFILRKHYTITNLNHCAEGLSNNDEYRAVYTGDTLPPLQLVFPIPSSLDRPDEWRPIGRVDEQVIVRRVTASSD